MDKKAVKYEQVDVLLVDPSYVMNDGWKDEDLSIWSDELAKLTDYYINSHIECHCSLLDVKPDCIFVEQAKNKRCGCGHFIVCVDTDGKRFPCQMFAPISMQPSIFEKVITVDFNDDSLFYNEKCSKCLLKVSCPACCGNNLIHKGALNAIDDFYCKAFIIKRDIRKKCRKVAGKLTGFTNRIFSQGSNKAALRLKKTRNQF